jgi:YNFM family putative membrane transporter
MSAGATSSQIGRTVLLLSASGFAASVNLRSMDIMLPSLSADFGVTVGQASVVITAYALGYGACQLAVGLIGDRFGKYRLIMILCLLSAVASAAAGLAASIGQLAVARLLAGVAASGIVPLAMAWIGDHVPMAERQPVMARYMSGTISGGLLGQVIGGILAEHFGWRMTTVVFAAGFLVVAAALAWGTRFTSRSPAAPSERTSMMTHLGALRHNRYGLTVLGGVVIEGIAFFGPLAFTGASLHHRFGIDLGTVGLVIACFPLGGLVYSFWLSRLLKRYGQASMIAAGGGFAAIGLCTLGASPYLWSMPIAVAVMGFGFYLIHNPLQVHATQIIPAARGTGVAMFATSLFVAQSAGVALVAPIVDRWGLPPVYFLSAAILAVSAAWLAKGLGRRSAPPAPAPAPADL